MFIKAKNDGGGGDNWSFHIKMLTSHNPSLSWNCKWHHAGHCELQWSMVVLGCDHRMTINCSSHRHVVTLGPCTFNTSEPACSGMLRFVIRQSQWKPLGRGWNHFCSDCIQAIVFVWQHAPLWRLLRGVWNACFYYYFLQCFDTVGWVTGRASGV